MSGDTWHLLHWLAKGSGAFSSPASNSPLKHIHTLTPGEDMGSLTEHITVHTKSLKVKPEAAVTMALP